MFVNDLIFKIRDIIEPSPAKRDRLILATLIVSAVLNILAWLIIPIYFWHISGFAVLQYNIYFGISSLGPWLMLFFMPLAGLLVAIINYSAAFYLYLKEKVLSLVLACVASAFQLIILAALALIVYMNM